MYDTLEDTRCHNDREKCISMKLDRTHAYVTLDPHGFLIFLSFRRLESCCPDRRETSFEFIDEPFSTP